MQLFVVPTFHISKSCSSTADPGNIGRPHTISNKMHPTPLQEEGVGYNGTHTGSNSVYAFLTTCLYYPSSLWNPVAHQEVCTCIDSNITAISHLGRDISTDIY